MLWQLSGIDCGWWRGFNVIRFPSERRGGYPFSSDMRDFSDWIRLNEMVDLPVGGARYTWTNKQQDPITSRLGRF